LIGKSEKNILRSTEGSKGDRSFNRLDNKDVVRETSERARKFREGKLLELRNCNNQVGKVLLLACKLTL